MQKEVRISFLGDVYLGDRADITISSEVKEYLSKADAVIANQEGPITDHAEAIGGKCCLRSSLSTAAILRGWGVDLVSLANNHMFDYGWEGFEQTRELLTQEGIRSFGAGKNLAEASEPLILEIKGFRIGLLTYSWGFVQTTCATEDSFGCAPLDEKLMMEQIQSLKNQVDAVIVQPHWGYCEYLYPTPDQVLLGKRLIEAGAKAVIGHHSHIVQGAAGQSDWLIAYSLGNFAFADYTDRGRSVPVTGHNRRGIILQVTLRSDKTISYEPIFTFLRNGVVSVEHTEGRRDDFWNRSKVFSEGDYTQFWRTYTRFRLWKRILYWCNPWNWRYIHRETFVGGWLMLKGIFSKPDSRA